MARSAAPGVTLTSMKADPLTSALDEIGKKVDPDMAPLVAALKAGGGADDAWAALVQEVLDEA